MALSTVSWRNVNVYSELWHDGTTKYNKLQELSNINKYIYLLII